MVSSCLKSIWGNPDLLTDSVDQKTKNKYKNLKKQEIQDIYPDELDETCFQHGMVCGYFQDLARRTASDKVLEDKAFNFLNNP